MRLLEGCAWLLVLRTHRLPAGCCEIAGRSAPSIQITPSPTFVSWYMQRNGHAEKNGGKAGERESDVATWTPAVQSRDSQRTVPVVWDFQKPKEAFRDQTGQSHGPSYELRECAVRALHFCLNRLPTETCLGTLSPTATREPPPLWDHSLTRPAQITQMV